ncbi:spindlin interactor and repressor of chromatin-binding protein isoform X1 [Symphalangus syndactylus]|uniref:spindlin interactor and repressor of chromatin-binding protein isoform X1 n=2 Tax=Symphalangus syndactylus TaxID=9590 RepID=UPI002441498E|nr:spindlin interactor and repressor of chromatin-binding protein isoform X1 [Symphalangus syndactylus]
MALKAEGAALDCFEVTLKCEEGEDEEEAMVVAVIPRPEPMLRVTQQEKTPPPRPSPLEAGSDGCEEPKQQVSWEQEFLVGSSPGGSGRALCMVCGAEIRAPSADTARSHILEQHPHTLDLSPSEKSNILEAWSEGVALLQDVRAEQPSPPNSDSGQDAHPDPDSNPDPARMPAEIVVLLDSEDNPSLPKRSRPRGLRPLELPAVPVTEPGNKKPRGQRWKEPPGEEPVRKKRGRPMTKNLDPDPEPPSPDSPTETFAAPAEVRHFTDGSFPAGFVLQLFSHTQLRGPDSKDSSKDREAVEGGLPRAESPSPGSLHFESWGTLCANSTFLEWLSACGWRSPQQSASCKTGPGIPRAPSVWEQVTPQTGRQFCQNPALLWRGSRRKGMGCKFLLSWGGREGGGSVPQWLITRTCLAHPPGRESRNRCQGRRGRGQHPLLF